jgi:hypothetical protein
LGTVLKQQGELRDSANALQEAIHLQPDFAGGAHTTLAGVLRQLGDSECAAAEASWGGDREECECSAGRNLLDQL